MPYQPVLLIHGGAWAMPDDAVADHERGIRSALATGWSVLERGGSAVDAVEEAVAVMEDDDTFDAGRGSFLTRDGRVQLDALLMQGADLRTGGVACVERLRNPIRAARLVLDHSPHVYFVSTGAERFARQHGMALIDNTELIVPRERERLMRFQAAELAGNPDLTFSGNSEFSPQASSAVISTGAKQSGEPALSSPKGTPVLAGARSVATVDRPDLSPATADPSISPDRQADLAVEDTLSDAAPFVPFADPALDSHDTVGAVALDRNGNVAAGTSTGGTLSKAPGRVGDSSLIGCGCYADNLSAAVSLTGWGEPIMKLVLGKWAVDRVAAGHSPQQAATDAIAYLHQRLGGHGGIILLGPDGRIGLAHNTPRMAWGIASAHRSEFGITRNQAG